MRAEAEFLHWILSDEYIVLTKMRNYRFELERPGFDGPRDLLDSQCRELCHLIDEVDGFVRARGGRPLGTLKDFLDHARIKIDNATPPNVRMMLESLLEDHELLLRRLRERELNGVLARVERGHERMAWMLRKLLEAQGAHERHR